MVCLIISDVLNQNLKGVGGWYHLSINSSKPDLSFTFILSDFSRINAQQSCFQWATNEISLQWYNESELPQIGINLHRMCRWTIYAENINIIIEVSLTMKILLLYCWVLKIRQINSKNRWI